MKKRGRKREEKKRGEGERESDRCEGENRATARSRKETSFSKVEDPNLAMRSRILEFVQNLLRNQPYNLWSDTNLTDLVICSSLGMKLSL